MQWICWTAKARPHVAYSIWEKKDAFVDYIWWAFEMRQPSSCCCEVFSPQMQPLKNATTELGQSYRQATSLYISIIAGNQYWKVLSSGSTTGKTNMVLSWKSLLEEINTSTKDWHQTSSQTVWKLLTEININKFWNPEYVPGISWWRGLQIFR